MKKLAIFSVLGALLLISGASPVAAQTTQDMQAKIAELLAQIESLKGQLKNMQPKPVVYPPIDMGDPVNPALKITSLSINEGGIGDTVRIYGSGFAAHNKIVFVGSTNPILGSDVTRVSPVDGETVYDVSSVDGKTLSFTVPSTLSVTNESGATITKRVIPGLYYIVVTNGYSKSNPIYFKVDDEHGGDIEHNMLAGNPVCVQITRDLRSGKRDTETGGEVSTLQRFLKDRGYYTHPQITGYFGPVTETALQRYQAAEKIVSAGAPNTTGYGVVGPRTREVLTKAGCENGNERRDDNPKILPVTGQKSIQVLTPNGGEALTFGSEKSIEWRSEGVDRVSIYLWFTNGSTCLIGQAPAVDGKFKFTPIEGMQCPNISAKITQGNYRVLILGGQEAPYTKDSSDSPFYIGDPNSSSVSVFSPNGGEVWEQGSKQTITWATLNLEGALIDIWFNADGTQNLLASQTANDGKETILVPSSNTDYPYKILVIANKNSASSPNDFSDGFITLAASNQNPETPFTVVSPAVKTTWKMGTTQRIEWRGSIMQNNYKMGITLEPAVSGTTLSPITVTKSADINKGYFDWTVLTGFPPADYVLRFCSYGGGKDCAVIGQSQPITIAPPGWVRVTYPNGGEVFEFGKPITIKWESEGVNTISFLLTPMPWCESAHSIPASLGQYTFIPTEGKTCPGFAKPITAGDGFKIHLFTELQSFFYGQDMSDNVFSILSPKNTSVNSQQLPL